LSKSEQRIGNMQVSSSNP